ncbi:hypothetical protein K438DRAFT_1660326, partial [Mycena galopus ATCC 62051]
MRCIRFSCGVCGAGGCPDDGCGAYWAPTDNINRERRGAQVRLKVIFFINLCYQSF